LYEKSELGLIAYAKISIWSGPMKTIKPRRLPTFAKAGHPIMSYFPQPGAFLRLCLSLLVLQAISSALNAESYKQLGVSLIWLPNGLLIGVLVSSARRQWPIIMATGLTIDFLVNVYLGGTTGSSLTYTTLNALEITIASTLTYKTLRGNGDLTEAKNLKRFLLCAVGIAPLATALSATCYLHFHDRVALIYSLRVWWAADMLGIATVTPLVLSYFHRIKFSSRSITQVGVLFSVLVAVTLVVFQYSTFPMLWLVLIVLLLLGVRLGYTASALGLLIVIAIGGFLTICGHGPLGKTSPHSLPDRLLMFQFFIAFAMISLYITEVAMTANRTTQSGLAASEARFKALADELEGRVAQRTKELQNEIAEREVVQHELLNAKVIAEDANAAKSSFLANMSHELRTPLNAIIGYSEMLQEDAEQAGNNEAFEDLRRIRMAGRHLLSLINDVLDLSKIEAGRLDLYLQSVSVLDVINDVKATIIPLAVKQNNVFHTELYEPALTVQVDVVKFKQCLLNLLSNACKFTANGHISLTVQRLPTDHGNMVSWRVSDTGMGIAEENIGRLFHTFSQVDTSATRRHDGTGLGLAISQRLVQLMGGWISVESKLGVGSSFTIYIPHEDHSSQGIM
jgi:signal transduction histidine kinase